VRVRRRPDAAYPSLALRVFAVNALVLVVGAGVAVLVVGGSGPVAVEEVLVLAGCLIALLLVNRLVLARTFAPLQQVLTVMRTADPLAPGRRLEVPASDSEASELAGAFNEMAERLEAERRESTRRTLGAQEAERGHIARELHDEVGQQLTALLLLLSSIRRSCAPETQRALAEAHELAWTTLDDVRRVARELRPEGLDDLGLPSALAALADRLHKQTGCAIEVAVPCTLPALSEDEELVVYRVAQEALTNVIRHAGCEGARLQVLVEAGELVLEVRDAGRGFDPKAGSGAGLRGMRERALLVGARLAFHAQPGQGTLVRLALPLRAA
jgi:two-component system, NarL family, sensor histidine kinase UhpB